MSLKITKVSVSTQKYTQQELGFTCIKPIKGELFVQFRDRSIYVSNMSRVISTDFQGRGYERELIPNDTGNGLTVVVRRPGFLPNGERLHNMVAEAFMTNPFGCKRVKFLDGDYHNCKLENLYYAGHKEKADRRHPKDKIFEELVTFPFTIGSYSVNLSGIIATERKAEWSRGEKLRRLETMHIKEYKTTDFGFNALVIDGGGARSTLSVNNGFVALKTSWGACITVKNVNKTISEKSDLNAVLKTMTNIYHDYVFEDNPMELVDMHIDNIDFVAMEDGKTEAVVGMAA